MFRIMVQTPGLYMTHGLNAVVPALFKDREVEI